MKRLAWMGWVGWLGGALLAGCDEMPINNNLTGEDVYATTEPTDVPVRTDSGTQLGSEGFWGCPIEKVELIADGSLVIDDIGGSPNALTPERIGLWPIDIVTVGVTTGTPTQGSVTLRTLETDTYQWVDVAGAPGCVDQLAVSVEGLLAHPDGYTTVTGFVAITKEATRLLVTSIAPADALTVWGTPAYPADADVSFRIFADMGTDWLSGSALFVDCPVPEVSCETGQVVAEVSANR